MKVIGVEKVEGGWIVDAIVGFLFWKRTAQYFTTKGYAFYDPERDMRRVVGFGLERLARGFDEFVDVRNNVEWSESHPSDDMMRRKRIADEKQLARETFAKSKVR